MDAETRVMNARRYAPVDRCVYCFGESDLTDEHIVPLGLSGTAVLPKASCKSCAAVTSQIELRVLREGTMHQVRVHRDLKSRSKHKDGPRSGRLTVSEPGEQDRALELPLAEYPILLFMPHFAGPGTIEPHGYVSGVRLRGIDAISFGADPIEVMRSHAVAEAAWEPPPSYPIAFAQMIAKIGYCFAVAERAWSLTFGPAAVVSDILGKSERIGWWVGTTPKPNASHEGLLHRLEVCPGRSPQRLLVEVQLFSDSGTRTYGVVLEPLGSPTSTATNGPTAR